MNYEAFPHITRKLNTYKFLHILATMSHEEPKPNEGGHFNLSTAKDVECIQEQEDSSIETPTEKPDPLYCVLSERAKILTICTCSMVIFLGPISASIYLPALGSMAGDLNVSISKINLTITAYKVSPIFGVCLNIANFRRYSKLCLPCLLPASLIKMVAVQSLSPVCSSSLEPALD